MKFEQEEHRLLRVFQDIRERVTLRRLILRSIECKCVQEERWSGGQWRQVQNPQDVLEAERKKEREFIGGQGLEDVSKFGQDTHLGVVDGACYYYY